jgi:Ca-activated chloride channel family protein
VTVTDHSGKAVAGLDMTHFTIFDGDTQQKITHFSAEDAPSSIGIVFDASDSMGPKMRKAREAVNALLNSVNQNSEFFLERFSNRAEVIVPMTSHLREIHDRVERLEVGGGTALLDGVRLAMEEMQHAHYLRKAIVIISDGEDNSSHWTVPELKEAVREKDILIYAIAIPDGASSYGGWQTQKGPALLQDIAAKTGGTMFPVSNIRQIPDVANKIGTWLRSQYVLGFAPDNVTPDGSYRQIRLKIERPKGFPRFRAVWRQGYFAPKE